MLIDKLTSEIPFEARPQGSQSSDPDLNMQQFAFPNLRAKTG
jgi:hypothetical protein